MYYNHLENNQLLWELKRNKLFCTVLAYSVTFCNYREFKVTAYPHSIELRKKEVILSIILYVGYEKNEFLKYKTESNVYFISFSNVVLNMQEFKEISPLIKCISGYSLFFTALNLAPDKTPISNLNFMLRL